MERMIMAKMETTMLGKRSAFQAAGGIGHGVAVYTDQDQALKAETTGFILNGRRDE